MENVGAPPQELGETEERLLNELRAMRRRAREAELGMAGPEALTLGQKVADKVAAGIGSWPFIIIQTSILTIWIALNVTAAVQHWDPYPFILLNLGLSCQAAYAAPFIMMSQNRQQEIDRREATHDHQVNIKAELEIELLHQKIDELREREVFALAEAVKTLTEMLQHEGAPGVAKT